MDEYSDFSARHYFSKQTSFQKIVPKEQRDKFRMVYKSRMGGYTYGQITNSDMIFFDHYIYQLRDELYS